MKRNLFKATAYGSLLGLVALFVLFSCQKEISNSEEISPLSDSVRFHTLMIDGNKTIIKEVKGIYYFSDHEILSKRQFNYLKHLSNSGLDTKERSTIITNLTRTWTNAVVPYKISYPGKQADIQAAMNHISSNTRIRFVTRTTQADYIEFIVSPTLGISSSEQIGREGGRNYLRISANATTDTIVHEIMHALGFFHEQAHSGRNSYLKINYQNMNNDQETLHQFNIQPGSVGYGPLDFESIMMYGSYAFSKNGYATIVKLGADSIFYGQRTGLSAGDIAGISHLYQYSITGSDNMCNSGIYALSSPPSGATITWQISSTANATLSTSSGSQVTVTRKNDIYARLTLTATVTYQSGRTETVTKTIYTDCQIPYDVQALRNNRPLVVYQGGVVFTGTDAPFRQFGSDWVPFESPYIIPGMYNLYAYLPAGTIATININGTNKTVTGNGVNSGNPGSDNGILLGIYTVSPGFYVKANIQN